MLDLTPTASRPVGCVVAGSCVLDLLCRPVTLAEPIGRGVLHQTQPLLATAGGITANAGITMAGLGVDVSVFSLVGDDAWAPMVRSIFDKGGVNTAHLMTHPTGATSTTVVAIDPTGERSFLHCVGAPKLLDADAFLSRMDLWETSRVLLLGYYSLLPSLQADLPRVFAAIREAGCLTAMDAAGDGGAMQPLDVILPHLDIYIPSLAEAVHQTGEENPEHILATYRRHSEHTLLGVKLGGTRGVLLSPPGSANIHIPSCTPPAPVVDTTGAGDSFYAGLIAGLLRGLDVEDAARLGTAAAAFCVTALGGNSAGRSYKETAALAGIGDEPQMHTDEIG